MDDVDLNDLSQQLPHYIYKKNCWVSLHSCRYKADVHIPPKTLGFPPKASFQPF